MRTGKLDSDPVDIECALIRFRIRSVQHDAGSRLDKLRFNTLDTNGKLREAR